MRVYRSVYRSVPEPAPDQQPAQLGERSAPEALLTPAEVATMFRVDPKTVTRWAQAGKLTSIRTLGGHRRYREAEVFAILYRGDTARSTVRGAAAAG
jgi:excisionase family DNA binding protein